MAEDNKTQNKYESLQSALDQEHADSHLMLDNGLSACPAVLPLLYSERATHTLL
jgi:hypothetical protein